MQSAWPWQPVTATSPGWQDLLLPGSQRCPGTPTHSRPHEKEFLLSGGWKELGVLGTDQGVLMPEALGSVLTPNGA